MKKTRFKPPYKKDKKATFNYKIFATAGVYLIKNKNGKIVYVGHSQSNLYKTMYRHFQEWKDKQYRATYPKLGYTVRVVKTTPKQAVLLESLLIEKHKPKDNPMKINLLTKKQVEKIDNDYKVAEIIPESELSF